MQTLQTNESNRQNNQKFSLEGATPKDFRTEVSEVQEKPEVEVETKTAIKEAVLLIDVPITTVERDCYIRQKPR